MLSESTEKENSLTLTLSSNVCNQVKSVCGFKIFFNFFLSQNENDSGHIEPWLLKEMDTCISSIFLNEDQDAFVQLFNLILYESVNGTTIRANIRTDVRKDKI